MTFPGRQLSKTLLDMELPSTLKGPMTHPCRAAKSSPLLCPRIVQPVYTNCWRDCDLRWKAPALRITRQRAGAEEQKLQARHEEPEQEQKPNGLAQSIQVLAINWQRSSCGYCLTAIGPGKQQGYQRPADRRLHSQHFVTLLQARSSWYYLIWQGLGNLRAVFCPLTALTINIQSIIPIPEWEGALTSA